MIRGPAALDLDVPAEPADDHSAAAVVVTAEPGTLIWRGAMPDGTRAVFKMYRRRSLTTVWRSRFSRFRVEREYDALTFLQRLGIRCSEPLLWTFGRSPAHGRYEILATREIAAAVPLSELLENATDLDAMDLSSLYQTIRTIHGKGLQHGALIPRNILVTRAHGGVWMFHMIDMPRAIVFPADIQGTRMASMDLMDLTGPVRARFGDGAARTLLGHYGLSEQGIAALFEDLKRYHPNRHTRTRLRGEFKLRAMFAWLAAGRRPSW
jgi:hypothetical protein